MKNKFLIITFVTILFVVYESYAAIHFETSNIRKYYKSIKPVDIPVHIIYDNNEQSVKYGNEKIQAKSSGGPFLSKAKLSALRSLVENRYLEAQEKKGNDEILNKDANVMEVYLQQDGTVIDKKSQIPNEENKVIDEQKKIDSSKLENDQKDEQKPKEEQTVPTLLRHSEDHLAQVGLKASISEADAATTARATLFENLQNSWNNTVETFRPSNVVQSFNNTVQTFRPSNIVQSFTNSQASNNLAKENVTVAKPSGPIANLQQSLYDVLNRFVRRNVTIVKAEQASEQGAWWQRPMNDFRENVNNVFNNFQATSGAPGTQNDAPQITWISSLQQQFNGAMDNVENGLDTVFGNQPSAVQADDPGNFFNQVQGVFSNFISNIAPPNLNVQQDEAGFTPLWNQVQGAFSDFVSTIFSGGGASETAAVENDEPAKPVTQNDEPAKPLTQNDESSKPGKPAALSQLNQLISNFNATPTLPTLAPFIENSSYQPPDLIKPIQETISQQISNSNYTNPIEIINKPIAQITQNAPVKQTDSEKPSSESTDKPSNSS